MKVESINCKIKKYTIDSMLLIILLIANIVLICNLKFLLSTFFSPFLSLFVFFWTFFLLLIIFMIPYLIRNMFKIIPFVLVKRRYSLGDDNYVINDVIITSNFLYYLDNYMYKRINIDEIKIINKRLYCSILIYRRFPTTSEKFIKERGIGPFRGKNEFGDINYCLRIIDKNDNTTIVKLKTTYFWSVLDTTFYETIISVLRIYNKNIELGEDELIKLHWNVKFRKQRDFDVKDYLVVNEKVYDRWVLDFDENKKK